jgi:Protein of unknown function (DUF3768)
MIHAPTPEQCAQIAMLNDQARRAIGILCSVCERVGVRRTSLHERQVIRALVETYDGWKHSDDPYDEHDFGVVYQLASGAWTNIVPSDPSWVRAIFWKFDYRDKNTLAPSPAPWDAERTLRVLNFMLPGEYGGLDQS